MASSGHKSVGSLRAVRALLAPLLIALPPLFWVVDATRRAMLVPLGRDQGIFQYIAWALSKGQRDYRDVRDVNGPLTHFVHLVMLKLGGRDEHVFRVLDTVVTLLVFAVVGGCIGGALSSKPKRALRRLEATERVGWALAGWVVLSAQYLGYVYWDIAQRESFFDWFMLPSVALQLVAQARMRGATDEGTAKRQRRMLVVVGFLGAIPWFGKPTYVLFTLVQLAALFLDREMPLPRRARFTTFGIGAAVGALTQLLFLLVYGDIGAYVRIVLVDVPTMYRFIWVRAAYDIFANPAFATEAIFAVAGAATMVALIVFGQMPRRALVIALVPVCGLVNVVTQAKGFPYHFHPVSAGVHLQWLAIAAWAWESARGVARRHIAARFVPFLVSGVVALRCALMMEDSPHIRDSWIVAGAATPEQRETQEYFRGFPEPDFFPYELRQAARYLRDHTKPDDRVQAFGMDPYLLFLAERLSATPYIYAYDLDDYTPLRGGTGGVPTEEQAARIRALRDEHERDMLDRLKRAPPAAFVFLDKSPLLELDDAWADFRRYCPTSAAWVEATYSEAVVFGAMHVWMRRDLEPPSHPAPDE
jgi:hypothetical protein